MAKISKDLSVGNLHPRETIFGSGIIGAVNGEVIVVADGASSLALDLRGTFSGTIEVSGSVDGTNWTLIPVRPINQAGLQYVSAVVGTAQGIWMGKIGPFRLIRARCTAFTSGSFVVTLTASPALLDDTLAGFSAPLFGTTTAATGVAATLTLASPGAGLRQYLTFLRILRSATAVLTPAAAPTVVTTTNLPGSMAYSFGQDAAAQGQDKIISEDFAYPIPASAQGTAVTIVAPAVTGVIWRISAGYFIAP